MSAPTNDDVFKTVGELRNFLANFDDETCIFIRDAGVFCIRIPKKFKVMWPCHEEGSDDLILMTDVHFANEPQRVERSFP